MDLGQLLMEQQGYAPMDTGVIQPQDPNLSGVNPDVKFQENRGKWKDFMDRMQNDPHMKQSVLQMGLRMMQGPQNGQNNLSLAGSSLEAGVNTLQALRERDRLHQIEAEDRLLKRKDTESQISTRDRTTSVAEGSLRNQQDRTMLDYNEQMSKNADLAKQHQLALDKLNADLGIEQGKLAETTRHNKASEAIDAQRARSYDRAAGGGGGSTAADTVKINNLRDSYIAQGLDPTEAAARATREVMTTGKARDPSALFNDAMKVELSKWQANFDNLGKEPDPKTWQAMRDSAMAQTKAMLQLQGTAPSTERGGPIQRPTAATPPIASAPAAVPAGPSVPSVDPQTQEKVKLLRARGVPDDKIRAALQSEGKDSKAYGL